MGLFNLIVCLIIFIPQIAIADTKKEIAICAAVDNDAKRLECFDNLSTNLGVDKPSQKTTKGNGKWKIRKEISPIDDSTNVYVFLDAEDIVKSGHNTSLPRLYVRCMEKKTTVYIMWNLYLGIGTTNVLTRFDKEEAFTDEWNISTNYKSVFVKGNGMYFALKMMRHNKLLVQLTPYGTNPVMASFNIEGLEDSIVPLEKACNWD